MLHRGLAATPTFDPLQRILEAALPALPSDHLVLLHVSIDRTESLILAAAGTARVWRWLRAPLGRGIAARAIETRRRARDPSERCVRGAHDRRREPSIHGAKRRPPEGIRRSMRDCYRQRSGSWVPPADVGLQMSGSLCPHRARAFSSWLTGHGCPREDVETGSNGLGGTMVSEFDAPLESNDLVGVTLDRSDRSPRRSIRPRASELKWALAEVAQLVEQWSEESRTTRFAKLLGNSRLIPKFRLEEQWSQRCVAHARRRSRDRAPCGVSGNSSRSFVVSSAYSCDCWRSKAITGEMTRRSHSRGSGRSPLLGH